MANKWIGIGRLTKDPDVRFSQEGTCVARYTVAIDRGFKKDETDFIPCVAFRCYQYNNPSYKSAQRLLQTYNPVFAKTILSPVKP